MKQFLATFFFTCLIGLTLAGHIPHVHHHDHHLDHHHIDAYHGDFHHDHHFDFPHVHAYSSDLHHLGHYDDHHHHLDHYDHHHLYHHDHIVEPHFHSIPSVTVVRKTVEHPHHHIGLKVVKVLKDAWGKK